MDTTMTAFRALALCELMGGGGSSTVVIRGEITCTDDGEGNVTITQGEEDE